MKKYVIKLYAQEIKKTIANIKKIEIAKKAAQTKAVIIKT